jgi:translation initiation factor 1
MPKKIPINQPATGFNNPFGSLDMEGLPPGQLEEVPEPAARPQKSVKLGRVVLRREKAHRGGKTVIVVHDFAPSIGGKKIEELARKLKAACACGGTVRERAIEIQGDQPGRIRSLLQEEGFQVAGVS